MVSFGVGCYLKWNGQWKQLLLVLKSFLPLLWIGNYKLNQRSNCHQRMQETHLR